MIWFICKKILFSEADAARENLNVEGSLEENWELKDVRVKMLARSNQSGDKCLEDSANEGLFFTILSTIYVTITEYATSTVPGSNTVLFKSSGGCLPSNVQELFTASCSNLWFFLVCVNRNINQLQCYLGNK